MQRHVVAAVFRREFNAYFASPTGYVFITVFVFLSSFAAFWLPGFFERNLANLDQLGVWFPALLLFVVPAVTMGAWAEERRQGTDELLLTLPASSADLVLGKFLAGVAIYTVALAFAAAGQVSVLAVLGSPDAGVLASTYAGQWLAGASLIAVGMIGSALTANLTVAFIVGAALCAAVVGLGWLAAIVQGSASAPLVEELSLPERLRDFWRGVVSIENLAYFAAVAAVALWVNVFIVSRMHWAGSPGSARRSGLAVVRGAAFVVAAVSAVVLIGRAAARLDVTAERLWSLSPATRALVGEIPADRPVLITAFVSPDVPRSFTQKRESLLGLLRELDKAAGGDRIAVNIIPTEPFTEEAREAQRDFGITPRTVPPAPGDPDQSVRTVFLGVAFASGPEQTVIPFMSRGLPVEYELARAVRTVSQAQKRRVGILQTDMKLFGSFDFQTFTPSPDWPIVAELRKQYDVEQVAADSPIPDTLDALLVAQPSGLTDAQLAHLLDYIRAGRPAIIFEDPLPLVNPGLATSEPRGAEMNPFQRQQQPQSEPKADLAPLWELVGAAVTAEGIVWDAYNPRPQLEIPREVLFIGAASGAPRPFNPDSPVTRGLQEVVLITSGAVAKGPGATTDVAPLMTTSPVSGRVAYAESIQRSFFGPSWPNPARRFVQTQGVETVAARITGAADAGAETTVPLNVVLIGDVDMISQTFFDLREQGAADFEFDNVPFILNAVDVLVGDESLVAVRSQRRLHRTLTLLEEEREREERETLLAIEEANRLADEELAAARARLEESVAEIQQRTDLDEAARRSLVEARRRAEQRALDVRSAAIEDEKQARILEAQVDSRQAIGRIEMGIRVAAVAIPPIPAFLLGCLVFARRRRQEREGVVAERLEPRRVAA